VIKSARTILFLLILLLPLTIVVAEKTFEVDVRTEVKIPMRDGVELSANIFLPKAKGKFPVILIRSPYGKGNEKNGDGLFYAGRGYVLVSQDCRGKGSSQGRWEPFANERSDGRDTQKWLLEQPWCNGSVGTAGGSYVGFTQWISAPNAGDHLKAMFPVVPLVDTYGDGVYIDGALNLALMMGWGSLVALSPGEQVAMYTWGEQGWIKAFRTLPLNKWDRALGRKVQYLRDWIAHPHFDEYWADRGVRNQWQDITVPTAGGCNLVGCPAGPRDQGEVEKRNDVLVFTSEALKTELEVTGPVKVILYAASTAKDTDFTAKLLDVHPDGRPFNLCDGIARASYRDSKSKPSLIQPGRVYRYEIDLWVTSNAFLPGHKIRVEISSSNFPRFDRNLNTGEPFGAGTEFIKATQTIYHNKERPSHILLPVIP